MKSILALSFAVLMFAAASEKARFSDFRLPFACVGNDRVPSIIF